MQRGIPLSENIISKKHNFLEPVGDSPNLSISERKQWEKWTHEVMCLAEENPETVYISGQTSEKKICLTFDDAPDLMNTSQILEILKTHDIRSSFSLVGVYIEELPELTRRIYEEGHVIINHTWKHFDLTSLDKAQFENEITLTENKIHSLINKKPALIRPPYGLINENIVSHLHLNEYKVALWSLNTFDWLENSKENIIKNVIENVRAGDIILMHSYENKEPTVEALPEIIVLLEEKGYHFIDVAEMLGIEPYKKF